MGYYGSLWGVTRGVPIYSSKPGWGDTSFSSSMDVSHPETFEREMRALNQAEQELGVKGELSLPESYFKFLDYLF